MAIDLGRVTRDAILKAIAECDAKGRDAFLAHHGFGRATKYELHHEARSYDSKAIVGVAYRYATGLRATRDDFSGGEETNRVLRHHGFDVVTIHDAPKGLSTGAVFVSPDEQHVEGAVTTISVNRYERDPEARAACLAAWGHNCVVCGFNFGAVYGPRGEGYIHVHHLHPLSQGERTVDPVHDLVPVCPNCHAMLHAHGDLWTPGQLRAVCEASQLASPRMGR
jgi:5-methylcytosine-specific restriction protein A